MAKKTQTKETPIEEQIIEAEAATQAAIQVMQAETLQQEIAEAQQKAVTAEEREKLIAEACRISGQVEGLNVVSKFTNVSALLKLKQIKESKIYRHIPSIETWGNYCKSIGFSHDKIDEDLNNLEFFGEDFLRTCSEFSISYRQLRQLKTASKQGAFEINGNTVIIEGEVIQLDDKDYLKDALTDLIANQQKSLKEKEDELKANKKVVQSYATEKEAALKAMKAEEKRAEEYKKQLNTVFHGRLGDVADADKETFQTIRNLEIDFDTLHGGAIRLLDKELSPFNAKMICGVFAKMMVALDDLRLDANAQYPFAFDGGILDRAEKALMEQAETPADFLKD